MDIVFFKPVDSEGSTYKVLPRSVVMHVMKKEKDDEEFWPRLLKDKALEKNRVSAQYSFYMLPISQCCVHILFESLDCTHIIYVFVYDLIG